MNEQTISPALDGLRWLEAAIFAGNIPVAIQTFIWLVDCGWDYGDLVEELHHIHYAVHQREQHMLLIEQHMIDRFHDLLDADDRQEA